MRSVLGALLSAERASLEEEGGFGRYEKGLDGRRRMVGREVEGPGGRRRGFGGQVDGVRAAGGWSGQQAEGWFRRQRGGPDGR